jgi:hypothetical protein
MFTIRPCWGINYWPLNIAKPTPAIALDVPKFAVALVMIAAILVVETARSARARWRAAK